MSSPYFPTRSELFDGLSIEKSDFKEGNYIPVHAELLRVLIKHALASVEIDEESYLRYPDIAEAFENNEIEDPFEHYIANGYFEGRTALPKAFDENWYLENYKDVRRLLKQGRLKSAKEHYLKNGVYESRAYSDQSRNESEVWRRVFALSTQGLC